MKKNILAVFFIIAFSSVAAVAQGVFVPRPPAIYIPQLDPVRMHLEQQLFRDSMNAASSGGRVVKGKTGRAATNPRSMPVKTVKSVTAFTASGRILSSRLGAGQNDVEAKQLFDMFLDRYEKTAVNDGFPPNDLAYGFNFLIVNNYIILNDLYDQSPADKALMTPSGDPLLALQRSYSKQADAVTSTAENAVFQQIKTFLAANPQIIKLTDRQKQEYTEMLAVVTMTNFSMYETAGKNKDSEAFAKAQNMARQSLEKLFGVSADKIKITAQGLEFK